ncbi:MULTISPECIES: cell division topological specificity factor MinE [Clostridium]|jgi:cell division topological specificity factor MinE|uniref:Cell division topological specificity factor n=5 Tax=Clostridium TaxID=1485 RepID=MINE_CLOB8|nr:MULTISPECIES: cell division topological specificity factor MinE [Clostridium]A6LQQ6.1 RecName: Full=Cell division topological specificity factor [Clostridium beijerinckii NCIMB 8052]ABR32686.1 cell division topological specificity factor MinE [Clostridium beijerinckii NCIMB 8052]AIU04783.1 cell division topological specificity factor MinE [Clostridium beijerinckii ATCC 35702]AJG97205.1 cell division topological specificity factor MinE [Clostridium beijerinckii]ALB48152.1 cell division topol
MGFFKSLNSKPTPKEVAKDRLKLILIHDRGEIAPDIIEKIREEILEVISKYIDIQVEDVEISVNKNGDEEGENTSALIANIPIKSIKGR